MPTFLKYRDDLEQPAPDESETIRKIIDLHIAGSENVRQTHGGSVRISHAKAYAFLKGQLVVSTNLPTELAQGLFAAPQTYDVVVRMAHLPGEVMDDRTVSAPRGMAIKVMGVTGEMLPGHEGQTTQDFVLNTGKSFTAAGPKEFLASITPNLTVAPKLPEGVKGVVSTAARATNAALSAVGLHSGKLDIFGHPPTHPLGESYYSQVPLRFGDYLCKLSVTPANPPLEALIGQHLKIDHANGLRGEMIQYFKSNPAIFNVNVQLAVDEKQTPIEDAKTEWPEDVTPYRPVAQLILPPQDAWDEQLQELVDSRMSFSPHHSLAAHRPLGGIMRARLATYPALAQHRMRANNRAPLEPKSAGELP